MKAGEYVDIYKVINLYKNVIDEYRPFEGEMLKQLKDYYRIGLTWSSNALEIGRAHV